MFYNHLLLICVSIVEEDTEGDEALSGEGVEELVAEGEYHSIKY